MVATRRKQPPVGAEPALREQIAALEERVRRLQAMLDGAPQGTIIHTHRVLYCNQAAVELFGYDSAAALQALPDINQLFDPEQHADMNRRRRSRMRGDAVPETYEIQGVRQDGSRLWLRVSAQRVDWEGGPAVHCTYTNISDHRRAEEELVASRRQLRTVLDALPQWVALKDRDQRYLLVNHAMASDFGLSMDEIIGRRARDLAIRHPDSLPLLESIDSTVINEGRVVEVPEYTAQLPDGTRHIRRMVKVPLHNDEGQVVGLVGISMNITEYATAQQQAAAQRRLLQAVLDAIPDWLFVKGLDNRYMMVNDAFARDQGQTPAELRGRRIDELGVGTPEQLAAIHAADRQVVAEGRPNSRMGRLTLRDGRVMDLHTRKVPLRDETGEIVGVVGLAVDVTEQRRAQEQLAAQRRLLQAVFDTIPAWLFVKDLDSRYLMVNNTFAQDVGVEPHAFPGHTAEEMPQGTPGERERTMRDDRKVLDSGEPLECEDSMTLPDGRYTWRHVRKVPLLDEQGRTIGLVGMSMDVTQRMNAEAEVRNQRRLLQAVFDAIPTWLFVKDLRSRFVMVNDKFAQSFDREPAAFRGLGVHDLPRGSRAQRERILADDQRVIREGQSIDMEEPIEMPGGSTALFHTRKVPLRDEHGKIIGLVGMSEDVTERRLAQEELATQRRLLQSVMDTIPIGVFVKNREHRIWLANQAMADLYGVSPEALIGCPTEQIPNIADEDRQLFLRQDDVVFATGSKVPVPEYVVTLPSGEHRTFRGIKVPLRDESGVITGIVGVAEDVTDQVRSAMQVRESQRLLQTVFDTIPAWLFVKDMDGRYLMVNDTFGRDVGIAPQSFVGRSLSELPQGTDAERERARRLDWEVLHLGRDVDEEDTVTLPDGRITRRHMRKVPLRDEQGQIAGLVGLAEDVTERRQMEEQLRRMQRIEAIGTLAGGIAHDFNNILGPIIGFTELTLRETPAGTKAHQSLSIVRDAGLRARDIVSQILTFSRRTDNRPEVVEPQALLRETLRFLRYTLPRTVRIEEHLAADVPPVFADAVQLHQVLMNLCVNAVHAMPDGGVLTVGLESLTVTELMGYTGDRISGACVRFSVSDTGTGMDASTMARIFEPFFTTKPVGQGTGLGLSTVLGIVTQHKGVVDVRSTPGEGSRFEIYLPVAESQPQTSPQQARPAHAAPSASILFVDDEPAITELARQVLEEAGYRVSAFTSSVQALQAFEAEPGAYDLVLTDQTMPGLTGDRLAQAIRARRADVPILLGTGYSEVVTSERAVELGVNDVFYKPLTPSHMVELVRNALSARTGKEPSAAGSASH